MLSWARMRCWYAERKGVVMAVEQQSSADAMESFYEEIHGKGLDALWRRHREGRPDMSYPPRLWKWSDIERFAMRATELVTPGPGAERRVLTLSNPAASSLGATHTMTGAIQIVMPGEIAPSHRHTAAAI